MLNRGMKFSSQLIKNLGELGVTCVYLFGSRAQNISRPESDYDFGVLLKKPSQLNNGSQDLYQKIYDLLQDLIGKKLNIDIVFLDRAPLQLRFHVLRCGKVMMDRDPLRRGHFEERTLEEHADFEPYRRLFEEATLAQIP